MTELSKNTKLKDRVWGSIRQEAEEVVSTEPALASYYYASILKHDSLREAISFELANKLNSDAVPAMLLRELIERILDDRDGVFDAMVQDICAHKERDPACDKYSTPLLYFKGFNALAAYRIAHELWQEGREYLAFYLQNKISECFGVDIHPGAIFGAGIMIDHATGLVVGETSVLGNNISIFHSVTLGGIGCESGERHPKIEDDVLISVGAKILGNVSIGRGAKIAAGSVVLSDIPANATVAGVPAKAVGQLSGLALSEAPEFLWEKMNCD
ncbi:MAG: serine O-acetyltransferase [Cellvibrionaceae bacterium]